MKRLIPKKKRKEKKTPTANEKEKKLDRIRGDKKE